MTDNGFSIKSNDELYYTKYIYYFLSFNNQILKGKYKGTAQKVISKTNLKLINIIFPPLEVQKEIVDYCDNNNNLIEKLEQEIERNRDLADKIINSICQKVEVKEEDNSSVKSPTKNKRKIKIKIQ